jgi:hypothetical protein
MAKHAAVCNRFPELQIGTDIKFSEGSYETDNEELWEQLQKNEWWGVFIHPRDTPPEGEAPAETPPATEGEEPQAEEHEESHGWRARRGSRGSR